MRQNAYYRDLKCIFEDLLPLYCYATKANSRTIRSRVSQPASAGKESDLVNCKLPTGCHQNSEPDSCVVWVLLHSYTSETKYKLQSNRIELLIWGGLEWHCMTARSCSARAGVKRIYTRMPDSRTKASTCFAAAVLRRISWVEKFIPRSSTACFKCRRTSENLGQTWTCSTVSGISHWSQSPSGWRPIRDIWWFRWVTVTCAQTKDSSGEGVGRQRGPQQGRKDMLLCIHFLLIGLVLNFPLVERVLVQIWQHISKIQSGIYLLIG